MRSSRRKRQPSNVHWRRNARKIARSEVHSTCRARPRSQTRRLHRTRTLSLSRSCVSFGYRSRHPHSKIPDVILNVSKRAAVPAKSASAPPPIPKVILPPTAYEDNDEDEDLFAELDPAAEIARVQQQAPPAKKARVEEVRAVSLTHLSALSELQLAASTRGR